MDNIKNFFDIYKSSVYNKDSSAFLSLFDNDIYVFDLWERWSYEGKENWQKMVTAWFKSLENERVVVDFDNINITKTENMTVATAFATYTAVNLDGKELRSLQNRLTWVIQKIENEWKIIHEHTSAPINPENGQVIFKRDK